MEKIDHYTPVVDVVAMTQPVGRTANEIPPEEIDKLVAFFARISNPSNKYNNMTSSKLINFLIREGHWSPLDMVTMSVEIIVPRDISRQVLRHYSMRFQEFSQRYSEVSEDNEVGFALREARLQDISDRQNSLECTDESIIAEWHTIQLGVLNTCLKAYHRALELGIAKEQARAVLPEGLTLSKMFVSGSLRSWVTYFMQRTHPSSQKEHRMIATAIKEALGNYSEVLKGSSGGASCK